MSLRSKVAVLAAAALPVLGLAACGGDSGSGTPSAPQEQGVLAMLVADAKGSLAKAVDKATKAESVTMKMDGTAAGETFKGEGTLLYGKDPKAEFSMEAAGTATKMLIIGSVIYIEVPEADRAEMDGKRWMKMDVSAAGEQAGSGFAKQMDDIDPVRQVKTLLAAESVTVVGEETIDGVKTVHYTVTNPLATYLGQLDADMRAATEKELSKAGIKEIKTDLWVDEKYQPRRVHVVMGSISDITVTYTDYGKPATITAPPAAEVFDFAEMLEGLKTGG
ncbi:LppX_LprAFG lipoprotein [Phytohabitans houttuyneae]|uniref:Putative lipoprotein n=1 Tax=Phytohabitans houttuyneae TaxID=1076126 RepID=A0A6V8K8T2_9ACTN|nr:LppX_LprAFG lipoprotein [Phytohabitans houttuyneae]GFJ78708.1 putative lipoprotein [Phytohabitans houttuyneae]